MLLIRYFTYRYRIYKFWSYFIKYLPCFLFRMKKILNYNKNGNYLYGTVFILSLHYSIKAPLLFHFCTRILSMIKSNIHNNSTKIGNLWAQKYMICQLKLTDLANNPLCRIYILLNFFVYRQKKNFSLVM